MYINERRAWERASPLLLTLMKAEVAPEFGWIISHGCSPC